MDFLNARRRASDRDQQRAVVDVVNITGQRDLSCLAVGNADVCETKPMDDSFYLLMQLFLHV